MLFKIFFVTKEKRKKKDTKIGKDRIRRKTQREENTEKEERHKDKKRQNKKKGTKVGKDRIRIKTQR